MDIKARASAIVADYDKLYGEAIGAQMHDVTQPLTWDLLSKTNAFVYPKLRAGIEAAMTEVAGANTPTGGDDANDDTPQNTGRVVVVDAPRAERVEPPSVAAAVALHGKGKFAPRPVPAREELWAKVTTPGMSISKMAVQYKTKKESIRKWLDKRGIAWTTGADPVLVDGHVDPARA